MLTTNMAGTITASKIVIVAALNANFAGQNTITMLRSPMYFSLHILRRQNESGCAPNRFTATKNVVIGKSEMNIKFSQILWVFSPKKFAFGLKPEPEIFAFQSAWLNLANRQPITK